ncbi:MAG: alkaline phosphatase family protein [Proteobacteria bacterium]|nr:alkaline phosphatase family protein [Pseudomonadota bacterium]MCP4916797.1 alkaline phosphatase family protein [Pseudomonadota bacterium]
MLLTLLACNGLDTTPLPDLVVDSPPDVGDSTPSDPPVEDPGFPELGDTVDIVHVTLLSKDMEYADTDDTLTLCITPGSCHTLAKPDWDDNERAIEDVFVFEDVSVPRSDVSTLTLSIDDGGDQYKTACIAVSLDGAPLHCSQPDLKLGTDDDDELQSLDLEPGLDCMGCWTTPLTHGPILGPPEPDAVSFWYRTDATRQVVVSVGPSADALEVAAYRYPLAEDDFTDRVRLELAPGDHWVGLTIDGQVIAPFPVSVAAPDDTFRFAFGSCSKDDDQPIFEVIRAQDPDLFLFVGDNHYANSDDIGTLRQWYRWAHERSGRAELMATTATLATWDDHDFVGNNTDGTEPGKDVALRAFREYWPNPSHGTAETGGVFTRHRIGEVEFFLLDVRYNRVEDEVFLGAGQTTWLVDALHDSPATFKFIASGSQFTPEGSSDSWANYDDEYDALMTAIADVPGVILLSGDIHRSEFRLNEGVGYDLPEWTSSPLATSNSTCKSDEVWLECFDDEDYVIVVDVDVDTDPTATARILNQDGAEKASWTVKSSELR